ncbi:MAG TPA: hypothetical protein PKJ58_06900, partial [Prolixibacteraceae bacterium]|nr:hypothetical protein [Prolixibacteraceae bacterium]
MLCGLWLCMHQATAQAPEWSRLLQVPSYGNPSISCVAANRDYVATAGVFSGLLTYDGETMESQGELRDLFVQLSSPEGGKLW